MGTNSPLSRENMASSEEFTKSKIDRLGDRLRKGDISEADLRLLDAYRRSFAEASEHVFAQIRDRLGMEPTGRPAKSTTSISDKLRRESIRPKPNTGYRRVQGNCQGRPCSG